MLLEKLINPKPKTTLYFVVISSIFLAIPLITNNAFSVIAWGNYSKLFFCFSIIIIILHAFGLNNLIYKNDVIKKENLIIATVFVLLNTFNINASVDLISSFLMLFFLNYLLESYQKEYPFNEIFCCSAILSIIIAFNPIMSLMYFLLIASSLIFNYTNWRCYVVSFLGLIIPYLMYVIILSFIGREIDFSLINILPKFSFNPFDFLDFFRANQNVLIIFSVILLASFLEFFNWLYKKSIRSRKSFFIILTYLITSIMIALLGSTTNYYILIARLSVFIANYFTFTKKRNLANILFFIFIFSSFYYRWMIVI